MTAIETTMKEIRVRDGMRWVIYTDSLSSMLAIENNRENHPILNQIYDILAELQNQGKQITICKVPAHIGVKGNEEANKAAKQAIDIPGMTTTRLPYTDYYLTIRRARKSEWQRYWESINCRLHYIKHILKNEKVQTIAVGNLSSN